LQLRARPKPINQPYHEFVMSEVSVTGFQGPNNLLGAAHFQRKMQRVTLANIDSFNFGESTTEIVEDPRYFQTAEDVFSGYGGLYFKYVIDPSSEEGQEEAKRVLLHGKRFDSSLALLASKGYTDKLFVVSVVKKSGDNKLTYYLTPDKAEDLVAATGFRFNSENRESCNKRHRRAWANAQAMLTGSVVGVPEDSVWLCQFYDEAVYEIPMKVYTVCFDQFSNWSKRQPVRGAYTARIGVLQIDSKNPIHQKLVQGTDGGHIVDTTRLQAGFKALGATNIMSRVKDGSGYQFTLSLPEGQAKGNAVAYWLKDLDILVTDVKPQFPTIDGTVRLALNTIKLPGYVVGDIQSYINGNFEASGTYYKAARRWIASVDKAFLKGNDDMLRQMLGVVLQQLDEELAEDDESLADVTKEVKDKRETHWVLRTFLELTGKPLADSEGTGLTVLDFSGLATKVYRHLTEQFMHIRKLRIPLPQEWSSAGYAMFDISIVRHMDEALDGRGFYFDRGVLAAGTAALRHRVTDPKTGKPVVQPIEGSAVLQRQPNGTGREWVQWAQLVKEFMYDAMFQSPFFFMSSKLLEISVDGGGIYALNCLGQVEFDRLTAIWGDAIPTCVLWHCVMGGGDNDDRVIAHHDPKIVAHLEKFYLERLVRYPAPHVIQPVDKPAEPTSAIKVERKARLAKQHPDWKLVLSAFKRGMIESLSNADMFVNYQFANATEELSPEALDLASFCGILEKVVDSDKMGKGDNVDSLARKAIQSYYATVAEIPDFLCDTAGLGVKNRFPDYILEMRQEPVRIFQTPTGIALLDLEARQKVSKAEFEETFCSRHPDYERVIDYLRHYPISPAARKTAASLRKLWLDNIKLTRGEAIAPLNANRHMVPQSVAERLEAEASSIAVKATDLLCCDELGLVEDNYTDFQKEVAVALYIKIMGRQPRKKDGTYERVQDAQLFAEGFSRLFAKAIEWAHATFESALAAIPKASTDTQSFWDGQFDTL
jgi:hypothetical protein